MCPNVAPQTTFFSFSQVVLMKKAGRLLSAPNTGGESGGCSIMHIGNEIEDLLWMAIRSENECRKLFPRALSEFHCIFGTRGQYLKLEVQWALE